MAQNLKCCEIHEDLKAKLKKFRFRKEKTVAACILKIDYSKQEVILDEEYEETTLEELQNELPEHLPRYIILSYVHKHSDGRVSYPLCFIYSCPTGAKPEFAMMAAGSKNGIQNELGITKVMELRNIEDLTEEWLLKQLSIY